jgi:16S rRNA G527 N7-methylase RsmG
MPLAMTNPDVDFTGIDARRKKVDAVNEMIEKL